MRPRLLSICVLTFLAGCSSSGGSDSTADTGGTAETTSAADEVGSTDAEAGSTASDTSTGTDGTDTTTGDGDGDGPVCGNGVVDAGEDCDDANTDETDACTNACLFAECGDGNTQVGVEECDDGNTDPFDACTNECLLPVCGDGVLQGAEQCDAGPANGPGMACKGDCTLNTCGDGDLGPGEGCDDGNQVDNDICNNMCALASCGDAMVQAPEQCDDGNDVDVDACTNVCTAAACGDEFVQPGEECDEGGGNSDNAMCTLSCSIAVCGDDNIYAGFEECDDGANNGPGMACNGMCLENFCGDEDVGPGEECDNGMLNNGPNQSCLANCSINVCGDADQGPEEGCDDGNLIDGDGCNSMCAPEMAPPMAIWCGNSVYECGDTIDNDNDTFLDLADPDCTTPCDDDESSLQTSLPGQNNDCKQDCFWDANSGQGDDHCVWNLICDPENPGADIGCAYNPNFNQCNAQLPADCLAFCNPLVPNGCDCFGCCQIGNVFVYLDSNPDCSMDNLAACNSCTFFDQCSNTCEPENCELCFGQGPEDLPDNCIEPSCDFGSPCLQQADCPDGEFCQTGCCAPVIPG